MAMEDFRVDVVIGKGPGATAIPLEIPPFTLVGATTRAGLLPGPLRDRFGFTAHLEFYEPHELDLIVHRSAGLLGVELDGRGRRRDRLPLAGHPPDRQPAAAPGPRLRPGPRRRHRHARRSPGPRSSSTRSTSSASTGSTAACSTRSAGASAADRSASRPWPSPSGRSARPSRRSPSRSWSATASWPVRRGAGSRRPAAWHHLGLRAPPAPRRRAGRHSLRGVSVDYQRVTAGFVVARPPSRLHLPVGRPDVAPTPLLTLERFVSCVEFLPLVGIVLLFWLFIIRPAIAASEGTRSMQSSLSVGDEVDADLRGLRHRARDRGRPRPGRDRRAACVIKVARGAVGTIATKHRGRPADAGDTDEPGPVADGPEEN